MANIVIVTKQCYLLCQGINFISVQEVDEDRRDREISLFSTTKKKKGRTKRSIKPEETLFQIVVDFIPVQTSNGHNKSESTVTIMVRGQERCLSLYRDMVDQIREQLPDQLFLDKLVESFITANPAKV